MNLFTVETLSYLTANQTTASPHGSTTERQGDNLMRQLVLQVGASLGEFEGVVNPARRKGKRG